MKCKWIALIGILSAGTSFGASGFFGNFYVITTLNGGGNTFNQVTTGTTPGGGAASGYNLTSDGVNPQFSSFGTLDLTDVNSPTATFTLVPEPSAALLGGLGVLALLRRRRS